MDLSSYQGFRLRTTGFAGTWGPSFLSGCLPNLYFRALSKITPAEGALVLASLGMLRVSGEPEDTILLFFL